jgi:hypothetical protein
MRMHAAKRAAGKYGKRQDSLREYKTASIGNFARGPRPTGTLMSLIQTRAGQRKTTARGGRFVWSQQAG